MSATGIKYILHVKPRDGFIFCEKHCELYWHEDKCPICTDEDDEAAAKQATHRDDPKQNQRYYRCSNCGKQVFWEDQCPDCYPFE